MLRPMAAGQFAACHFPLYEPAGPESVGAPEV
jgi:hypothetical protein